jgi:hypothetical protein
VPRRSRVSSFRPHSAFGSCPFDVTDPTKPLPPTCGGRLYKPYRRPRPNWPSQTTFRCPVRGRFGPISHSPTSKLDTKLDIPRAFLGCSQKPQKSAESPLPSKRALIPPAPQPAAGRLSRPLSAFLAGVSDCCERCATPSHAVTATSQRAAGRPSPGGTSARYPRRNVPMRRSLQR